MSRLVLLLMLLCTPGHSLTVESDYGGRVNVRAIEVLRLSSSGESVRIVGPLCLSTCTMYLGARNVSICRSVTFGFHGPSFYGVPLSEPEFEHWSDLISSFYTPALADWYMTTGRYGPMHHLSAVTLFGFGYKQCSN